ncbi:hypothetical protein [Deinococcus cellulosilyticus]|uniref:Uncharacterized protein n=1 Tax=Deinococcus cellulosilyticus (strain DSM 18568 / NBRC 106333 / KACC 11606 / 5516J-15) TaxID=1223518 RepID=A0A511MVT7_DEIC1|nr:hypothetical protein [Deinococcus cellulosilyticus]GEM44693.1 hypothetical protein DC3_03280 [Deinococcus cellulosilyticus NBRC 106333 = KACC 11606]
MATQLGEDRKDALCYQLQAAHFLLQLGSTPEDHKTLLQALHRAHHHIFPLVRSAPLNFTQKPLYLTETDLHQLDLHRNQALECVEGALWLLEQQSGQQVPPPVQQLGLRGVAELISDAWNLLISSDR